MTYTGHVGAPVDLMRTDWLQDSAERTGFSRSGIWSERNERSPPPGETRWGIALGAVVSPTDAAATAIAKKARELRNWPPCHKSALALSIVKSL